MTRFLLALSGLVLALLPVAGNAAARPDCSVPPELIEAGPRLPELARLLREKHPITIVALGGASTAGSASGNAEADAYPRRLQDALQQHHPGVSITVVNKGVPRQTAQEMTDRLERDVYPLQPNLVVWETGTLDAARGFDVDVFASALEAGLADLRAHKLEAILMNMQYSRSTASVINFEPYLDAMQHRADVEDVYLFRRFEMMRYWSENGVFDFVDVPKEKRAQLATEVYQCLAERLADAIDYATREGE